MSEALVFGARDCRLKSCQGRLRLPVPQAGWRVTRGFAAASVREKLTPSRRARRKAYLHTSICARQSLVSPRAGVFSSKPRSEYRAMRPVLDPRPSFFSASG